MASESWRALEDDVSGPVIPIRAMVRAVDGLELAPAVAARIAALEGRMVRAEGALGRLGLERCPECGLWLPYQGLAPGAGCGASHEALLDQEAG